MNLRGDQRIGRRKPTHPWLRSILPILATCSISLGAGAAPVVLYDGLLGTAPDRQGWAWLTDPILFPQATRSAGADAASMDSTPLIDEKAGWFAHFPPLPRHPGLPVLDRDAGYRVEWEFLVLSETHVSPDRAGFSVIVLGDDLLGVELSFWPGEIWAQSDAPMFTHAEGAAFDTTLARTRYTLDVGSDRYELLADGRRILEGPLRDYSSFGAPYDIADFVFLGDDTSRGSSRAELARVEACTSSAPVSPGASLRLARDGADLVLTVADTGATEYRAYRDASPRGAFVTLHVAGPGPLLRDPASIAGGGTWYFVARAVDDCGRERD